MGDILAPQGPKFDEQTVIGRLSTLAAFVAMIYSMSNRNRKNSIIELWETLLNPDREDADMKVRVVVIEAANRLQVGEFQLMQLAYREWHGKDLPETMVARLFTDYILRDDVPHWARHYARTIIDGCDRGQIDMNAAQYHRYDHEYTTSVPHGTKRFCIAVGCLILFLGGGIILADMTAGKRGSMFPPYLDQSDLRKTKASGS